MLEAVAVTLGLATPFGIAKYNRSNFIANLQLVQARRYQQQNLKMTEAGLHREDIRDLVGLTVSKMDTYLLMSTLLVGLELSMFLEGKVPAAAPHWLSDVYLLSLFGSIFYLLISIVLAVNASNIAQSYTTLLLTHILRLPVGEFVDSAERDKNTISCEAFEHTPEHIFRVPLKEAVQKLLKFAKGVKTSDGEDVKVRERVYTKETTALFDYPLPHMQMYNQTSDHWRSHDAYARVCVSFGTHLLLHAIGYLCLCRRFSAHDTAFMNYGGQVLCVTADVLLIKLDLHLSKIEFFLLSALSVLGPALAFLAAITPYQSIDRLFVPLVFLSHFLWTLFMLRQAQAGRSSGGKKLWDNALPGRFRSVVQLDVLGGLKQELNFAQTKDVDMPNFRWLINMWKDILDQLPNGTSIYPKLRLKAVEERLDLVTKALHLKVPKVRKVPPPDAEWIRKRGAEWIRFEVVGEDDQIIKLVYNLLEGHLMRMEPDDGKNPLLDEIRDVSLLEELMDSLEDQLEAVMKSPAQLAATQHLEARNAMSDGSHSATTGGKTPRTQSSPPLSRVDSSNATMTFQTVRSTRLPTSVNAQCEGTPTINLNAPPRSKISCIDENRAKPPTKLQYVTPSQKALTPGRSKGILAVINGSVFHKKSALQPLLRLPWLVILLGTGVLLLLWLGMFLFHVHQSIVGEEEYGNGTIRRAPDFYMDILQRFQDLQLYIACASDARRFYVADNFGIMTVELASSSDIIDDYTQRRMQCELGDPIRDLTSASNDSVWVLSGNSLVHCTIANKQEAFPIDSRLQGDLEVRAIAIIPTLLHSARSSPPASSYRETTQRERRLDGINFPIDAPPVFFASLRGGTVVRLVLTQRANGTRVFSPHGTVAAQQKPMVSIAAMPLKGAEHYSLMHQFTWLTEDGHVYLSGKRNGFIGTDFTSLCMKGNRAFAIASYSLFEIDL
eukprot:GEMP01003662.1.p1 GENE.GEMP01003662.1~~GEMP01003662.1.p1  ORF type:complete len:949 (+),score=202.09 GEMP01003662.1:188-3034(+)